MASVREAPQTAALAWDNVPTMILCETRGLQLYLVVRGGIGCRGGSGTEQTVPGIA